MPALALLALLLAPLVAVPEPPAPDDHVVDAAGVLSEEGIAAAEAVADEWEARTTNDVVVAVVASLDGVTVEQYTADLLSSWLPGVPGQANGVAVVLAVDDLAFRVDADAGLEALLTEEAAAGVAAAAGPTVSTRDFDAAVLQLVTGVVTAVDQAAPPTTTSTTEPLRFDPDRFRVADTSDGAGPLGWALLALLCASAALVGRRLLGRAPSGDQATSAWGAGRPRRRRGW